MFPKILNFDCKDLLQRMWNYLIFYCHQQLRICVPLSSWRPAWLPASAGLLMHSTLSVSWLFYLWNQGDMLLKVQVLLFVPSERIFVLFCRSGSMCNCCIVLFYLTRQCLKGSMLWGLHFTSFCITKGKYQSTFIHQHPQVHHEFWNL